MGEWSALGLGRSALGPQRPTIPDDDAVLDFLARQVEGPSLGARMAELRRMRTPPPGEMASGPPMPGTPEYDLAMDVAGNFDFTGKLERKFSPKNFMRGDVGEIKIGRDIPELGKDIPGQVAGELFDLSRLGDYPKGLQPPRELVRPRVPPKAGIPQNVTDVLTPENAAKMRDDVLEGIKLGGGEWYNTGPMRQKLVDALGEQEGDRRWRLYLQGVAATSPRTAIPANIRNASFYFNKALKGEVPDPAENTRISALRRSLSGEADYEKAVEAAKAAGKPKPKKPKFLEADEGWPELPVPTPYGSLTQINNMKMMKEIMDTGQIKNPLKPASFVENLLGNLDPLTADVHFTRWLGLRDPKDPNKFLEMPEAGHYGTIEDWFKQNVTGPLGEPAAVGQASGWLGQGAKTGLKSPVEPFMATLEKLVGRTADILGRTKEQVWDDVFVKGKYPLLGVGGALLGEDDGP